MNQQITNQYPNQYAQTLSRKIEHARKYKPGNVIKYETQLKEWIKRYNPNPAPTYKQTQTQ